MAEPVVQPKPVEVTAPSLSPIVAEDIVRRSRLADYTRLVMNPVTSPNGILKTPVSQSQRSGTFNNVEFNESSSTLQSSEPLRTFMTLGSTGALPRSAIQQLLSKAPLLSTDLPASVGIVVNDINPADSIVSPSPAYASAEGLLMPSDTLAESSSGGSNSNAALSFSRSSFSTKDMASRLVALSLSQSSSAEGSIGNFSASFSNRGQMGGTSLLKKEPLPEIFTTEGKARLKAKKLRSSEKVLHAAAKRLEAGITIMESVTQQQHSEVQPFNTSLRATSPGQPSQRGSQRSWSKVRASVVNQNSGGFLHYVRGSDAAGMEGDFNQLREPDLASEQPYEAFSPEPVAPTNFDTSYGSNSSGAVPIRGNDRPVFGDIVVGSPHTPLYNGRSRVAELRRLTSLSDEALFEEAASCGPSVLNSMPPDKGFCTGAEDHYALAVAIVKYRFAAILPTPPKPSEEVSPQQVLQSIAAALGSPLLRTAAHVNIQHSSPGYRPVGSNVIAASSASGFSPDLATMKYDMSPINPLSERIFASDGASLGANSAGTVSIGKVVTSRNGNGGDQRPQWSYTGATARSAREQVAAPAEDVQSREKLYTKIPLPRAASAGRTKSGSTTTGIEPITTSKAHPTPTFKSAAKRVALFVNKKQKSEESGSRDSAIGIFSAK